ncbi:MAG: hypothetical protein MPW16_18390 [Candidatus Manganitrophus sp.]|nr:MAG: hypothetical protein MPW16_18390 [Candidatus Manganitrophus sp.]
MAKGTNNGQLKEDVEEESSEGSRRRSYPAGSFSDSLELGHAIQTHASGGRVRRLTLMEKLGRSATSGPTRQLITNSSRYGITKGSYNADWLELTPEGKSIVDESASPKERARASFTLAIENIAPFKKLYDEYVKKRLPAPEVMRDFLQESGESIVDHKECIDLFIVNAKYVGLLRTIGGSETLIPIDQAIDDLPSRPEKPPSVLVIPPSVNSSPNKGTEESTGDWDKVCFYITPIGGEDTEERQHADLFLGSLIEPAMNEVGLRLVRADKIGDPGIIASQIMEHVKRAKLVIADLSYVNPNVFYEMALRHACKLPIVHIIRKKDKIPFDVNQARCIVIDNTDIYSLVPRIQTYRAEIATQARKALEDPEHCGNPITVFYPAFWN